MAEIGSAWNSPGCQLCKGGDARTLALVGDYYARLCDSCMNEWALLMFGNTDFHRSHTLEHKAAAMVASPAGLGGHRSNEEALAHIVAERMECLKRLHYEAAAFCRGKEEAKP